MGSTTALPASLLTHVALPVRDLDATLAFYAKYTTLEVIHRRTDPETHMSTAWLANAGDKTSADNEIGVQAARFVIVLMSGALPKQITGDIEEHYGFLTSIALRPFLRDARRHRPHRGDGRGRRMPPARSDVPQRGRRVHLPRHGS